MDEKEVLEWAPLVDKVARTTCRDFPDSDLEDIQQAIWEALLTAQEKGKLMTRDEQYAESALFYAAKTAAWRERKEHLTISPQYGYRTEDVRGLLQTYFSKEDWVNARVPEDAVSELGNVGLEMSTDLSRAWKRLTNPHKVLIFAHFGLRESVDSKKLSRAISRMADILNTYQPQGRHNGPGRRKVINNVSAREQISKNTEE